MSKSANKWQPGPWVANEKKMGDLCDANGERVVFSGLILSAGYAGDRMEQVEANSRLARAAPDLYDSTLRMMSWLRIGGHLNDCDSLESDASCSCGLTVDMDAARAALAKARGES